MCSDLLCIACLALDLALVCCRNAVFISSQAKLGPNGHAALNAMARAGLLVVRPASRFAQDLPVEAYGEWKAAEEVVTAPSPAHAHVMHSLRPVFEKAAKAPLPAKAGAAPPVADDEKSARAHAV